MKISLKISNDNEEEIRKRLISAGFEIGEDGEYVLSDASDPFLVSVKDRDGRKHMISPENVIFIESLGHDVEVHTTEGLYYSPERLYRLCETLSDKGFIRISNSVIVARRHIKKIRPSFSMKFVLTLSDGTQADVTRSYYYSFKEFFRI